MLFIFYVNNMALSDLLGLISVPDRSLTLSLNFHILQVNQLR
jgi:hypothetical protein